jgi:CheY-like chemotaxis protein
VRKSAWNDGDLMEARRFVPPDLHPRILLADDDPDLRSVISLVLGAQGFDVIEARDGAELLDLVSPAFLGPPGQAAPRLPAELVISDLRMPGITGLSVLGGLRDLELRIPFILITAFGDAATHALAHQLGATAVLDKPFDMPSFLGLVRACVATY